LHTKLFDAFNHCGLETLAAMVSDDLEFLVRPDRTVGGKEPFLVAIKQNKLFRFWAAYRPHCP
jgi:hypothetical protein